MTSNMSVTTIETGNISIASTSDQSINIVSINDTAISLLSAGSGLQGIPGPRGPVGPQGSTGESSSFICSVPVSGHIAIILNLDGECEPASSDDVLAYAVVGVTTHAAAAAAAVQAQVRGVLEHSGWAFTPGQPVFLGLSGVLTQSLPVSALFSKVLGIAVSSTQVSLDFQPPIFIG